MNLFTDRKIITVSQLTALVREVLEDNFEHLWVEGEISNLATPSSGHIYFTLKDSGATVRCVMFKSSVRAMKFRMNDGMKILLKARMTVYDQRGDYQLVAEYAEPLGLGALQLAFQQTRDKLAKEGIFDAAHKKTIPALPTTVGIVTSPTGAAIHDILNVIGRRYANLQILIAPTRVQGEGAAAEIAAAISDLNRYARVDVIIVARGGGSIEDLWAFNEEIVARAIYASRLPIISAVGHEVDLTISDLVADLRAPTPSAAAELVVSSKAQMLADCNSLERRLSQSILRHFSDLSSSLEILKLSLKDPGIIIERLMQRLDELNARTEYALTDLLQKYKQRAGIAESSLKLNSPDKRIRELTGRIENLSIRSIAAIRSKLEFTSSSLSTASGRLDALSPLSILHRGYAAVTMKQTGKTVREVTALKPGDAVDVRFLDGIAECEVKSIHCNMPL
ncbi:MAG: exodeoxyribonuclease VII large subunit [Geobacteraceae bacterium]|nr:exodeoxyribonuclease VII large subunit [Geobacteraceae bacterium]